MIQIKKNVLNSPGTQNRQGGFTFIEMLVSLALASIVFVTLSMIFINSVRSTNRSNITLTIKQQGDFAISEMTQAIRRAQEIRACGSGSITIVGQDGGVTTFTTINQDESLVIASNAAVLTSNARVSNFEIECSRTGSAYTFASISFDLEVGREGGSINEVITRSFVGSAGLRKF